MTASGEDPRETLRRIHPGECGNPNGYQQISRARSALRDLGVPEEDLPEYDKACQEAWATYVTARRDRGGPLGLPPGPKFAEPEHGTVQRWRLHVKERRRLRAEGTTEDELPPICDACRTARRDYNASRKKRPKSSKRRRTAKGVRRRPVIEPQGPIPHGTLEGLKMHRRERRRLRAQGTPDRDLPPICEPCQNEATRIRVINASQRADKCGAVYGPNVGLGGRHDHVCRRPAGHDGPHRDYTTTGLGGS